MSTLLNTYKPNYSVHPGEYLDDVLESREIKQRELADRMGITENYLSNLLHGKKPVGPDTAIKLERVLGISASIWNNLNANYKLFEAEQKEKESLSDKINWVKEFPIAWMKKLGIIPETIKNDELIKPVLDFFGVSSPEIWDSFYKKEIVSYRKSDCFTSHLKASASWLRAGIIKSGRIETLSYNSEIFKNYLDKIKDLTVKDVIEFEPEMKKLCAEAGIALVFVPEPPDVHIYGATKWLGANKAMICLSLRHKSDDQFWFSFFHEAAHVLLHDKRNTFIDDEGLDQDEKEKEANRFSRNILIADKEYNEFVRRGKFYPNDIISFSSKQRVATGVVVGFLQHDEKIPYKWHNKLKKRYEIIPGV
ncbi:MAG: addiction module antidote protein, HigA family [Spirochaetes bacterium GWF1_41_5]|nr:MAG: addiction module antidote protein, HigA family [Spirochaetes bacterium GWF1_41_5]HBE01804.1 addiction module antidote protein, HigA family [Spirochaetia bacterium]